MEQIFLEKINGIIDKYNKAAECTGENFNVFKICGISTNEVIMCRLLYELLNKNGRHNQGDLFLESFITDVLRIVDMDEDEYKTINVFREFTLPSGRRIDILLSTCKREIPIEVKIYAEEQENQCDDYLDYAKKKSKIETKLYYLTLFGNMPSEYSYIRSSSENILGRIDKNSEIVGNDIQCVSFKYDIYNWLICAINDTRLLRKIPIKEIIIQYIGVIEELCGISKGDEKMEVISVLKDKNNFKAYIEMKKCETDIKTEVLLDLINDCYEKLKKTDKVRGMLDGRLDDEKNNVQKVCEGTKDTYPGFWIKSRIENVDLGISFEVDRSNGLYLGVFIVDENLRNRDESNRVREKLGINYGKITNTWPYWDVFKGNLSEAPNFTYPNTGFMELLDLNTYNEYVEKVCEELIRLYDIIVCKNQENKGQ